ncbi:DUF6355 family natural product biosynthesis protein [Lentzea sp. NPDC042327]|uniref:DUF6355 family natural product biosynthesis protein n=1 Tax=Lentzea sp. NPDC042327 TaxID=3154801 RepID=UPI0033BFECA4
MGRVVGTFVVAAGLIFGLLAGTSSAQVTDSGPRALAEHARAQGSASSYGVHEQGSASSYGAREQQSWAGTHAVSASYYRCGYYRSPYSGLDAFYTHCGASTFPRIRIQFNYGWSHRDITVLGTANLSRHYALQGAGMVTNAWCISDCW